MKIFWSWQNDFSRATCRDFIREALVEAINAVALELDLDEADRPELDQDTRDEPGMADIPSTIFQKISKAAVFVGDVTPVGHTDNGKALPNPNVLVELGWALAFGEAGFKRCVAVLNTASGYTSSDLPFDLRHRRILQYTLAERANTASRAEARHRLVEQLTDALRRNLADHREAHERIAAAALDERAETTLIQGVASRDNEPSIWATAGGEITHQVALGLGMTEKMAIELGPRSYIRVIPGPWPSGRPVIHEVASLDDSLRVWPPHDLPIARDGSFGPTDEGFITYWIGARDHAGRAIAKDVAMFFDETGEFWVLHGSAVMSWRGIAEFRATSVLHSWSTIMRQAFGVFDHLNASQIRRVEVGVTGVKNTHWPPEFGTHTARKDRLTHTEQRRDWSEGVQRAFSQESLRRCLGPFRSSEDERPAVYVDSDQKRSRTGRLTEHVLATRTATDRDRHGRLNRRWQLDESERSKRVAAIAGSCASIWASSRTVSATIRPRWSTARSTTPRRRSRSRPASMVARASSARRRP